MFTKYLVDLGKLAPVVANQFEPSKRLFFQARNFSSKKSFEDSEVWAKMSEIERINCALSESEPQTAKMAFFRGKGLQLQHDYNGAIHAYELATKLDDSYAAPSSQAIAIIYNQVGKKDDAFEQLLKAYDALTKIKENPVGLDTLKSEIGVVYQRYSLA